MTETAVGVVTRPRQRRAQDPLLRSKITKPSLPDWLVSSSRIEKRIAQRVQGPLTVVGGQLRASTRRVGDTRRLRQRAEDLLVLRCGGLAPGWRRGFRHRGDPDARGSNGIRVPPTARGCPGG